MAVGLRIGIELEILLTHRRRVIDDFIDLGFLTHYLIFHLSAARHPRPRVHYDVDGSYENSIWVLSGLLDDVTIKSQQQSMYVPMQSIFYRVL